MCFAGRLQTACCVDSACLAGGRCATCASAVSSILSMPAHISWTETLQSRSGRPACLLGVGGLPSGASWCARKAALTAAVGKGRGTTPAAPSPDLLYMRRRRREVGSSAPAVAADRTAGWSASAANALPPAPASAAAAPSGCSRPPSGAAAAAAASSAANRTRGELRRRGGRDRGRQGAACTQSASARARSQSKPG